MRTWSSSSTTRRTRNSRDFLPLSALGRLTTPSSMIASTVFCAVSLGSRAGGGRRIRLLETVSRIGHGETAVGADADQDVVSGRFIDVGDELLADVVILPGVDRVMELPQVFE